MTTPCGEPVLPQHGFIDYLQCPRSYNASVRRELPWIRVSRHPAWRSGGTGYLLTGRYGPPHPLEGGAGRHDGSSHLRRSRLVRHDLKAGSLT